MYFSMCPLISAYIGTYTKFNEVAAGCCCYYLLISNLVLTANMTLFVGTKEDTQTPHINTTWQHTAVG